MVTSESIGRYLYCIIDSNAEKKLGPIGIADAQVYTISNGRISAVVSDTPAKRIRPERRNLAAHQAVLKRIMEETTPLPMSFGIISDSTESIKMILGDNRKILSEQLARVANKVEMGMRITYDVPNIFEFFISIHPELRAARDKFFGVHREPSQEAKLELGRLFDRLLNDDRDEYRGQVEDILSQYCFELKQNKCRNEQELMNVACLVDRDKQDRFEEGVFEASRIFDNNFAFEYNGPWAPHNFVDINLKL